MKYQRGFGALETMIVLMIATLAAVGAAQQWMLYVDRQTNQAAAGQMTLIAEAASQYIKDNYATVLANASPAAPAVITAAMLRNTGYLPTNFADQNAYGQDYSVLALEPLANKLQTLIVTRNGQAINELYLIDIAKQIGAKGGYVSSLNTGAATGSFGGWTTALAPYGVSPGGGHLAIALFFEDGALVNDYLYRNAIPGQPNLNRMNTAIDMGGNNLNNTNVVSAQAANITNAVNAQTANINDAVNAQTANIRGNAAIAGETYTGGWFRSQGDGGWYSEKYNGGWYMADPGWVRSYGDKGVYTGGEMRAGKVTSAGRTEVGEYLQLDGIAAADTGCSPNGLAARTDTGVPLSCVSGVWKANKGVDGTYTYLGSYSGSVALTTGDKALMVMVNGGSTTFCGIGAINNRYALAGSVNGAVVASASDNSPDWAKFGHISFGVPAHTTFVVSSNPYQCEGHGEFSVFGFQL